MISCICKRIQTTSFTSSVPYIFFTAFSFNKELLYLFLQAFSKSSGYLIFLLIRVLEFSYLIQIITSFIRFVVDILEVFDLRRIPPLLPVKILQ